jgi:hypothetical protein
MTGRLVHPGTLTAWTRLLAMKEIKLIHESASELRLILERGKTKYGIHTKTLNLCSDRCSMNEAAFRLRGLDYSSLFDQLLWLPCTCHIVNNILSLLVTTLVSVKTCAVSLGSCGCRRNLELLKSTKKFFP